jgi:hypothetical protein
MRARSGDSSQPEIRPPYCLTLSGQFPLLFDFDRAFCADGGRSNCGDATVRRLGAAGPAPWQRPRRPGRAPVPAAAPAACRAEWPRRRPGRR